MILRDWKGATLWGVILWVFIFVEISVLMFMPGLEGKEGWQSVIHLIILPLLVLFCSYMYFKRGKASLQDGFLLGVFFLIVGTVLDLAITIPLFVKSFSFYMQWDLWLGYLEVVTFACLGGLLFKK